MSANTAINYRIGLQVDNKEAKAAMRDMLDSIGKLSTKPLKLYDAQSLKEGVGAAQDLEKALRKAFNVSTGNLDLGKFTTELNRSKMSIEDVRIRLNQIGPDGSAAFNKLAQSIASAQLPLRQTNQMVDNLLINLKKTAQWQISSTLIHGAVGQIEQAIGYVRNLNRSLTDISIVSDLSSKQLGEFAIAAQKMGKALSASTLDVSNAALLFFQQGDSMAQALEKSAITIKAANASANTSAAEMSEYLTAIWNSYKVGTEDLEKYVDMMAALGAKTASSMEEIATAMQKVAATANTVGVGFDQMSSIISTVSSVTRESAESIGTSYKTILARIGDLKLGEVVEDGVTVTLGSVSKELQKIGVNILDANGEMRDMGGVIEEIGVKWQGMTTAQKAAVAQTIAGKRQYTQLMALFENWDQYQKNMTITAGAEGSLDTMQDRWAEGWEAASAKVKNSMQGIWSDLINDKAITNFLNIIAEMVSGIDSLVEGMGGFGNVMTLVAGTIMSKFGNRTTEIFDQIKTNIKLATGQANKEMVQMQKETAEAATKQSQRLTGKEKIQAQHTSDINRYNARYNANSNNLTLKQRTDYQTHLEQLQKQQNEELRLSAEAKQLSTQESQLSDEISAAYKIPGLEETLADVRTKKEQIQQEMDEILELQAMDYSDTSLAGRYNELAEQMGNLDEESSIADGVKKLQETLAEQNIELDISDIIGDDGKIIGEAKDIGAKIGQALTKAMKDKMNDAGTLRYVENLAKDASKGLKEMSDEISALIDQGKDTEAADKTSAAQAAAQQALADMHTATAGMSAPNMPDLSPYQAALSNLKDQYSELITVSDEGIFEVDVSAAQADQLVQLIDAIEAQFDEMKASAVAASQAAAEALKAGGGGDERVDALQQNQNQQEENKDKSADNDQEGKNIKENMEKDLEPTINMADALVEVAGAAMQAFGAIQALGSAWETLNNADATPIEKVTAAFTALALVIPAVTSMSGAYAKITKSVASAMSSESRAARANAAAQAKTNLQKSIGLLKSKEERAAAKASAAAKVEEGAANEFVTMTLWKKIAAMAKEVWQTIKTIAVKTAELAVKLAIAILDGNWVAIAAVAVVAVAAVTAAIVASNAAREEEINLLKKEQEELVKEAEAMSAAQEKSANKMATMAQIINNTNMSIDEQVTALNDLGAQYGIQVSGIEAMTGSYDNYIARLTEAIRKEQELYSARLSQQKAAIEENSASIATKEQDNWYDWLTTAAGGIAGGATWLGQGIAGIFTGKGFSEFNSENYHDGYDWVKTWENTTLDDWANAEDATMAEAEHWQEFALQNKERLAEIGMRWDNETRTLRQTRELVGEDYQALYEMMNEAGAQDWGPEGGYTDQMYETMEGDWGFDLTAQIDAQIKQADMVSKLLSDYSTELDLMNTRNQDNTLEDFQDIIEAAGATTLEDQQYLAEYLSQFSNWSQAAQEQMAINEYAMQIAKSGQSGGRSQEDVAKILTDEILNGEDGITIDLLLKLHPTAISIDPNGEVFIREEAKAAAQAALDRDKYTEVETQIAAMEDGEYAEKEVLTASDYEAIKDIGLFEGDDLTSFMTSSPATRALMLEQARLENESKNIDTLEALIETNTAESEALLREKEEYLSTLDEALMASGLDASKYKGLEGEELFNALSDRQAELQRMQSFRLNYGQINNSEMEFSEIEDQEAYRQAALSAMSAEEYEIWSKKTTEQIFEGQKEGTWGDAIFGDPQAQREELDAIDTLLAEGISLSAEYAESQRVIAEAEGDLEAAEYWERVGEALQTATEGASAFADAMSKGNKMSAEDLAKLIAIDPSKQDEILNAYAAGGTEWAEYAYNEAMRYYAQMEQLYANDPIMLAAILQEKEALQTDYYSTVQKEVEASAKAQQDAMNEEIKNIENAMKSLEGIKLDLGIQGLGFDELETLRQRLMEVYNDAELVDAMIKNIGKEEAGSKEAAIALADAKMALAMKGHSALVSQAESAESLITIRADVQPPLKNTSDGIAADTTPSDAAINVKPGSVAEALDGSSGTAYQPKTQANDAEIDVNADPSGLGKNFQPAQNGGYQPKTAPNTVQITVDDINSTSAFNDDGTLKNPNPGGTATYSLRVGPGDSDYIKVTTSGEGGAATVSLTKLENGEAAYKVTLAPTEGETEGKSFYVDSGGNIVVGKVAENGTVTYDTILSKGNYENLEIDETTGNITISGVNSFAEAAELKAALGEKGVGITFNPQTGKYEITATQNIPEGQQATIKVGTVSEDGRTQWTGTGWAPILDLETKKQVIEVEYIDHRAADRVASAALNTWNKSRTTRLNDTGYHQDATGLHGWIGIGTPEMESRDQVQDFFKASTRWDRRIGADKNRADFNWYDDWQNNYGGAAQTSLADYLNLDSVNNGSWTNASAYENSMSRLGTEVLGFYEGDFQRMLSSNGQGFSLWKDMMQGWIASGRDSSEALEDMLSYARAYYGNESLTVESFMIELTDLMSGSVASDKGEAMSNAEFANMDADYKTMFIDYLISASEGAIDDFSSTTSIVEDLFAMMLTPDGGYDITKLSEPLQKVFYSMMQGLDINALRSLMDANGNYVILGYLEGLINSGAEDQAMAILQSLGYASIDALAAALETASPSKATKRLGHWTVEGFEIGLEEGAAEFDPSAFGETIFEKVQSILTSKTLEEMFTEAGITGSHMSELFANLDDAAKESILDSMRTEDNERKYATWDDFRDNGTAEDITAVQRSLVMQKSGYVVGQLSNGKYGIGKVVDGVFDAIDGMMYDTLEAAENALIAGSWVKEQTPEEWAKYVTEGFWDDDDYSDLQKAMLSDIFKSAQEAFEQANPGQSWEEYLASNPLEAEKYISQAYADYQYDLNSAVDLSWAEIKQTWVDTLTECQEIDEQAAQDTYDRWIKTWEEIGKARIAAIQGEEGVSLSDSLSEEGRTLMIDKIFGDHDWSQGLTAEDLALVTGTMRGDVKDTDAKYLELGAYSDSGFADTGMQAGLNRQFGYVTATTAQQFQDNLIAARRADATANFNSSIFGENWNDTNGGNFALAAASLFDENGERIEMGMEEFFNLDAIKALGIAQEDQATFYGQLLSLLSSGVLVKNDENQIEVGKDANGNSISGKDAIIEKVALSGLPTTAEGWDDLFKTTTIAALADQETYLSNYKTQKTSEYETQRDELLEMQDLVRRAMEDGWDSLKPEERDLLQEYMDEQGWDTLGEANLGLADKIDAVTAALDGMLDALRKGFVPDGNGGYVDPTKVSSRTETVDSIDGIDVTSGFTIDGSGNYVRRRATENADGTYSLTTDTISAADWEDSYISPYEIDDGFNNHYYAQEAQEYGQNLWRDQSNTSFGALETVQTESQSDTGVTTQSLNALEETLDMTNPHIAEMYENFRRAAIAGEDLTGVSGDLTTAILQGDGAMLQNDETTRRMLENWAEMYGIVDENGEVLTVDYVNGMRRAYRETAKMDKQIKKIEKDWKKVNKVVKMGNKEYTEFGELCVDVAKEAKKAGKSVDDYVDDIEGLTEAERELAKTAGEEMEDAFADMAEIAGDNLSKLPEEMQLAIDNMDLDGFNQSVIDLLDPNAFNTLLTNFGIGMDTFNAGVNSMCQSTDETIRSWGEALQASADSTGQIDLNAVLTGLGVDVSDPIAVITALMELFQTMASSGYFPGASSIASMLNGILGKAQNLNQKYGNGVGHRGSGGVGNTAQNKMPDKNDSGGGGGGGGEEDIQEKDKKEYNDEIERYHEIQEEMKRTSEALDQIEKHKERAYGKKYLNLMDQEIEKLKENIEEQQRYQDQIAGYLAQDRQAVAALGAQFDAEGNITNYTQVMQSIIDDYNAAVELYNSGNMTDEQFEDIEEQYEDHMEALEQYEETLELSAEAQAEFLELQNQLSEANLEKITYKMEIVTELNDADLELLQYYQDTYEDNLDKQDDLMRNLTQQAQEYESNILVLNDAMAELQAKFAAGEINEADFAEGMQELRDQAIGYAGDLEDLKDQFVEVYQNALDLAAEEVQNFTEKMQDSADMMDTYISLTQLMGRGTNYRELEKFYDTQYKANLANLEAQRAYVDSLEEQAAYFEEQMDKNHQLTETEQEQYEALQDALREANSELASTTEAALSSMQAAYENSINAIFKELDASIAGTAGSLADLADQYAYYQEEQSRYVSTAKELFEISKLNRSIEQSLEDATTDASKAKLKALQEEINYISEKNDLTEYDIEMMNLQYQLTLAQIALEEAQASKDTVRLTRDQDGNMAYQYTANQEKVHQAQQQYENVLQQINDLAANRVSELEQQCLEAEQQYLQSAQEILLDTTLTEAERTKKLEELSQRYSETLLFIQGQYNNASQALTQNQQAVAEHYGQALVNSMGEASLQMNTVIGDMIGNAQSHIDAFNQAIEEGSMGAWSDYMKGVTALTNASGLTYDNLIANADDYTEVAENANQAAQDLIDTFTDSFEDINAATEQWDAHLATLEGVQQMYENIATSAQHTLEVLSGFTAEEGVGYTDLAIAQLFQQTATEDKETKKYKEALLMLNEVFEDPSLTNDQKAEMLEEYEEELAAITSLTEQRITNTDEQELKRINEALQMQMQSFLALQSSFAQAASADNITGSLTDLNQHVEIIADFPNATDQNEIRLAFEELINLASQHVYSSAAIQKNR